ncbi:hypothetical protein SYNTR_0943 [Candidatus Syntrophocurvum alkaliphilum]|uniref:Uncharacterized protein n=1 Tax=Candidatus Syntrophocurvum alkaliphilum TaxID=2293317 RepID=A0A6I6DE74_9FIRM|nr:hypothetical protein SYNTR_0943 [Candidatus Syntrophocurvum alkaliphilum]
MCGEYGHSSPVYGLSSGSPPHVRGIFSGAKKILDKRGITPACAGNISSIFDII